ncbi:sec-independent protein translocase protein TatA [Roseibium hamelinense]|uniref:Sec-independent protein translocase protein TatA n=1 Tax=Roseibium hamelinense TaxID=150831 RepID=A0A562THN9_9HYPH|nr:twin-arginine translocase TatA/TatE family subunit [Roseibium hamelinense]MTI45672.1 twin-arginine translocase TatA/TatE family subunit [Roseibium hamelinense]TWI93145.1 sec-independent protein translocase protein TatA [Roseibium hamelinense]
MGISFWQIAIIAVIVVLLFGRGKISALMGDVAQGIKSFKKGMAEDDVASNDTKSSKTIDHDPAEPVKSEEAKDQSKAS